MLGATASGAFQDKFGRRFAFGLGGIVSAIGTYFIKRPNGLSPRFLIFRYRNGIHIPQPCRTYWPSCAVPLFQDCDRRWYRHAHDNLSDIRIGHCTYQIARCPTCFLSILCDYRPIDRNHPGLFPDYDFLPIIVHGEFSQNLSYLLVLLIVSKVPFAAQWAFSGLAIISAIVLPESPSMLLASEKASAARKAYLRLHGSNRDADLALSRIQATLDHEKVQQNNRSSSFAECFQGTDRRRTLIIGLVALLQYFLGVSLLANSNYFLIMAGMSPTQSLQISQIGVGVQLVATVIACVTMTYFGRRTIVLWSALATGIVFVGMGAAGFYQSDVRALR